MLSLVQLRSQILIYDKLLIILPIHLIHHSQINVTAATIYYLQKSVRVVNPINQKT